MDVDCPPLNQVNETLPPAAACRAEVEQLLMFRDFAAAPQLSNFLKYIVEETLAQRGDQLKERNIAVHALMRSADFDPRLDSVVRVMAGKLRRALECYYQGREGATAHVRIEVPRGGYRPLFRLIEPANWGQTACCSETDRSTSAPRTQGDRATKRPVLAVLPLLSLTEGNAEHALSEALACEVCVQLRKLNWLEIQDCLVTRRWHGDLLDAGHEELHGCDFAVGGTCRRRAGHVRVTVQLANVSDGHLLWADQFDMLAAAAGFTAEDAIVRRICAEIGRSLRAEVTIDNLPSAQARSPGTGRANHSSAGGQAHADELVAIEHLRKNPIRPLAIVPVKKTAATADRNCRERIQPLASVHPLN